MYSDHSTPPAGDTPPSPRSVRPAPNLPAAGKPTQPIQPVGTPRPDIKSQATAGLLALEAMYGKPVAELAAYYSVNLGNVLKLQKHLMNVSGKPEEGGWKAHAEEIRSCATSLANAAGAVEQMAEATYESGKPHPLLTCGLLSGLPPGFLARVVIQGLAAEATGMLGLIGEAPVEDADG